MCLFQDQDINPGSQEYKHWTTKKMKPLSGAISVASNLCVQIPYMTRNQKKQWQIDTESDKLYWDRFHVEIGKSRDSTLSFLIDHKFYAAVYIDLLLAP